ncbi:MAG: dihydroorotase [Mariprofundales bacterium]
MLCIHAGRVIDPASGFDAITNVWIEGGYIVHIGDQKPESFNNDYKKLDAKGLIVAPGLVDMHVHTRQPGEEWKEDITTVMQSAIAGGVTSICCMPNTKPAIDCAAVVRQVIEIANDVGLCRLYPIAAVSHNLEGKHITEMRELARNGAIAFSDDGNPVWHAGVMRKALEYAASFGFLIIQHAEEYQLTKGGCINEGWVSTQLGVQGMPAAGEDTMVARDLLLVELTTGRYHIAHISSHHAIAMLRDAIKAGLPVTAEAAPHHFTLTEDAVLGYNVDAKMNPPLRTEKDRLAVVAGLSDGTISIIATDHAPHHEDDKCCGLADAAFGIVGLETLLPISLQLVRNGQLSLPDMLAKMTCNPANLLGLNIGIIAIGAPADICIFDESASWILQRDKLHSKSKNTPWHQQTMQGQVIYTLYAGEVVYHYKN